MRKIGFLVLALVLALGSLGIGYAKWTDQLVLNGTVNTGSVIVGILDEGTTDDGPNFLQQGGLLFPVNSPVDGTKDPRVVPQETPPFTTWVWVSPVDKNVASTISVNGETKGACAQGPTYYASVTETVDNAYPFYAPTINLSIANLGTVPVKIDAVVLNVISDPKGVLNCIVFAWTITPPGLSPVVGQGTLQDFKDAIGKWQIDPCDVMGIDLTEIFLECTPEDSDASFTITITASQWNEVQ